MRNKPGQIRAVNRQSGIKFRYGEKTTQHDAHTLCVVLDQMLANSKELLGELEARGYDLATLRLQIEKGGEARKR